MPFQTASNVLAAVKREAAFGVPEGAGAGASQIRMVDSDGLNLNREPIQSEERRRDQIRYMGRLGGKDANGSYITEITVGGFFDLFIESLLRGTLDASPSSYPSIDAGTWLKKVETPASPIFTSYTIEQYDVDIDESELFFGVRLVGAQFELRPNQMSRVTWNFQGVDRNLIASGSAPHFTSPGVTSGLAMIADDSSITYKGAGITTLTGLNLNFSMDNALEPTIGSFVSPDVFVNRMNLEGSVMAIREDLQALTDFDAETEFAILMVLSVPGAAPKETFAINLPRVKISQVNAPFQGGDGAKIETRDIMIAAPEGASNAVEMYTSTETPVNV